MGKRRVSRTDVAREAGVSKTTVTYVLRNTPDTNISEATRKRVREAAERLGYVPNFAASSLVMGKTEIVGILIQTAARQFYALYAGFIEGLVEASRATPYNFLYLGQDQPDKYQRVLAQGYVDGLIIMQSAVNDEHVRVAEGFGKPLLTVNYISDEPVPAVTSDYEGALRRAYEWLIGRGRSRIGLFIVDTNLQPNQRQIAYHYEVAHELGRQTSFEIFRLPLRDNFVRAFRNATVARSFDGVVVEGLTVTSQLMWLIERASQQLQRDIDVVSFNIADDYSHLPSGIRVLESPSLEVGRQAWSAFERLLAGESDPDDYPVRVPFVEYSL